MPVFSSSGIQLFLLGLLLGARGSVHAGAPQQAPAVQLKTGSVQLGRCASPYTCIAQHGTLGMSSISTPMVSQHLSRQRLTRRKSGMSACFVGREELARKANITKGGPGTGLHWHPNA